MMAMFNGGKLTVYRKEKKGKDVNNVPITQLIPVREVWFEFFSISADELYAAKQANVEIDVRVRIRKDVGISSQSIIALKGKQYSVNRVEHRVNKKNCPVTDIYMTRIEAAYDVI